MTTSRWRKTAAETIAYVIRRDGHLKTNAIRLKLREAYPFSQRKGWQYQCWLVEQHAALTELCKLRNEPLPKPRQPRSRKRRDVPGQMMLWGGGFLTRAA